MTQRLHPSLRYEPGETTAVIRLEQRVLCERTVQGIRRSLPWLMCDSTRRGLHLDLGAVETPTAGGLGRLVALHQQLRSRNSGLVLFNVGPQAHEVFRLTGLTGLLDIRSE